MVMPGPPVSTTYKGVTACGIVAGIATIGIAYAQGMSKRVPQFDPSRKKVTDDFVTMNNLHNQLNNEIRKVSGEIRKAT